MQPKHFYELEFAFMFLYMHYTSQNLLAIVYLSLNIKELGISLAILFI